jgi:hypothetical protein
MQSIFLGGEFILGKKIIFGILKNFFILKSMVKNPEVDKLIRMYNTAKEHIDLQEGFM